MVTRRLVLQTAALPLAAPPALTLKFVFSRPYDNPRTQWLIRLYREVCAMSGFGFEYIDVPPKRATAMVLSGQADGELGRTFAYQDFFPPLVRLSEPNNVVNFCVYGAGPQARFAGLGTLRQLKLRCESRRGIHELEAVLETHVDADNWSLVDDLGQGLRKLQMHRTDLYFDVQEAVEDHLTFRHCNGLPETPAIRQLGTVASTTGHCYLNRTHATHAPKLAAALTKLKQDGTSARLLQQCLREYQQRCLHAASRL
ncbi:hypothetical protein [Duganella lactea]|uniref:hypothetical protein n=1 Tax=Duganella lactea TaxID=2692173 RepID=UPI00136FA634|nr:hypothetical protein [Duganella lactea]